MHEGGGECRCTQPPDHHPSTLLLSFSLPKLQPDFFLRRLFQVLSQYTTVFASQTDARTRASPPPPPPPPSQSQSLYCTFISESTPSHLRICRVAIARTLFFQSRARHTPLISISPNPHTTLWRQTSSDFFYRRVSSLFPLSSSHSRIGSDTRVHLYTTIYSTDEYRNFYLSTLLTAVSPCPPPSISLQ